MKNYLFELSSDGDKIITEITKQHFYYKVYNEFLERFYLTNVEENEDFIIYIVPNIKVLMVLSGIYDECEVFDFLSNMV